MDESDPPVQQRVGERLHEHDATVAVAESATGGLVGSLLTDVAGSSDYFDRSIVAYSYDAKRDLLAVNREALDAHGAVSEPVARQLAAGVRDTGDATYGVATTGIAGPTGGSDDKPVGTVFVGVAYAAPWGTGRSETTVERYEFAGTRRECKEQFARQALEDLLSTVERHE
jgi:nicotinamide-nucleotide amidase